jgi:hypothetical protein
MPIYEYRCQTCATGKTVVSVDEGFGPGSQHRSPDYYSDPRNIDTSRSGETPKGLQL